MSTLKQFMQNVSYMGLANAAVAIKALILIPIIVKSLDAESYGLWAQIFVTLFLLIPIAILNLEKGLVRFLSPKTDKKDIGREFSTVLIVTLFWSLLVSFTFVLGFQLLMMFTQYLAGFENYIILIALILPVWGNNIVLYSYFRSALKIKLFTNFLILQHSIEVILIGGSISMGWGLSGALIVMLLNILAINIILFLIIVRDIGFQSPDYSIVSKYLVYSLPLVTLDLFTLLVDSSDRYLIGLFLGLGAVGVYAAVYNLSRVITLFAVPLNLILTPTLSKHYDNGKIDEVKKLMWISLKIFVTFTIPIIIGFTILAQPILLIMATREFSEKGAILVPFICAGIFLFGIEIIVSNIIYMAKKTQIAGLIWGSAAGINITLNLLFIPSFGILGAALTTLITYGVAVLCTIKYSMKYVVIPIDWGFILKCLTAAVIMGAALLVMLFYIPHNLAGTIIMIAAGVGIYFGFLLLFKGISSEEREFIRDFLRSEKQ